MAGSIVVVGTLTCYALLYSVCDLKAAQINEQRCLSWEFMLFVFELHNKTVEATKNICCSKVEGAVDDSTVIRWPQKNSDCKNLDDQARLERPEAMDSEAMFQTSWVSHSMVWFVMFTT